jgi:hypothetical protein
MVAGLVAAQLEKLSLADTARLATAFAAAKLTRLGPHLPPTGGGPRPGPAGQRVSHQLTDNQLPSPFEEK